MITSFRDHITEELIAAVKVAELRSGEVPRCVSTEVVIGNGSCDSLAEYYCSVHKKVCEFHVALCILGDCTALSRLEG